MNDNANDSPSLDVVQISCSGCGVCCMHMGSPPFMPDEVARLPDDVKASYHAVRETRRLQYAATGVDDVPCGWFDMETRQCRHYAHRPECCSGFTTGGEYCVNMRQSAGLPV